MNYEEFIKATPEQKAELKKKIQQGIITSKDIEITLKVLERYADNFEWHQETASILKEAAAIIESEREYLLDEAAHSEITIEMEQGRDIPLAEWARINNVDPANARQRALRGTLPAHKVGNTWMINEFAVNKDAREKNN